MNPRSCIIFWMQKPSAEMPRCVRDSRQVVGVRGTLESGGHSAEGRGVLLVAMEAEQPQGAAVL